MSPIPAIVIIGMGPKGLYCFERLLAELKARFHPEQSQGEQPQAVQIHLVHHAPLFGVSPIYDTSLGDHILLNNSIGDINIWTQDNPPPVVENPLRFVHWYNQQYQPTVAATDLDYLPRAKVGHYLNEGFKQLCQQLPPGVKLNCHVGTASNIRVVADAYQVDIQTVEGSQITQTSIDANKVLLATGHARHQLSAQDRDYGGFANRHSDRNSNVQFIPHVYPINQTMTAIAAGENVFMKGIGLTFIDAALELTEGRGGRFQRTDNGLVYHPSGLEPGKIMPFSTTGLPKAPKAEDLPIALRPLIFCSPDKLAVLRDKTPGGQLDFATTLKPLIDLEIERAYYLAVMAQLTVDKEQWQQQLIACEDDGIALREVIGAFLQQQPQQHPQQGAFDPQAMLYPLQGHDFSSSEQFSAFIIDYMAQEITRAQQGHAQSPSKCALDIWYEIRYALSTVMQFSGIKPQSHQYLYQKLFPKYKRIIFGPPVISIEKLLALTRAGLVDFAAAINPQLQLDEANACFTLHCPQLTNTPFSAKVMVDARYPSTNLTKDTSSLTRNLLHSGMIRPFINHGANQDYQPGAIDMTPDSQCVIGLDGQVNADICVIGIPTEGNIIGNESVTTGHYPGLWAKQVLAQLLSQLGNVFIAK
ncbi:MAG: hypothetical protein ACI8WB_002054 [Phenylobacterium sp.]|jgi:hypothetical protein